MTGFREQGSGIPLMLLHGISSAPPLAQANGAERFSRAGVGHARLRRKPDAGRSAGERGDYADALAAMLDRAGVWQAVLVGHSLGALVASAFAAKFPERVIHLVLADAAQGYGNAAPEQREQVWRNREQQMALGATSSPRPAPRSCCAGARAERYRHRRGGHAGAAPGRLPRCRMDAGT